MEERKSNRNRNLHSEENIPNRNKKGSNSKDPAIQEVVAQMLRGLQNLQTGDMKGDQRYLQNPQSFFRPPQRGRGRGRGRR